MRTPRFTVAFCTAVLLVLPNLLAAQPQPKTPTQSYTEFYAAVAKATTLAEVLPYLSAAYLGMLESRQKADQPVWLGRIKDGDDVKNLAITKETVDGDKCTVEATGVSAKGNPLHGKITMVKEGGGWKIDAMAWAT